MGDLENHFGKYPGKGDKPDVAISVKSHDLELSSFKRGAFFLVGTQDKLKDLHCFGKNMGLGKCFLKKVMFPLPSAFANPHPPLANSLGASASSRRCTPLSLPDFYLSRQLLFIPNG